MTKAQRDRTLHLARRLVALADGADRLESEKIADHIGLTVSMAICLVEGFVAPNGWTLELLEGAERQALCILGDDGARRILTREAVSP